MARTTLAAALALALFAGAPRGAGAEEEKKGPPFGERSKAPTPKPAERTWTVTQEAKFSYTVAMKPGIPNADELTEILVSANAIPKTPHPRFGTRVPLEQAYLVVEVTSPAGELVGRYRAHPIPLSAGKYGLHFTPAQDGVYTLAIRGKDAAGANLAADLKLPVNVWPLPAELEGTGDDKTSGSRKPVKG